MTQVKSYTRALSAEEALAAKRANPAAAYLAGGTLLLAGDSRDKPETVIDVGPALPREILREGAGREDAAMRYVLGAGATLQELAESSLLPAFLVDAALSMVNRNTRNRATLGGNLAADKSCSSLVPLLLALGTELEILSPSASDKALSPVLPARIPLESWLKERENPGSTRASDLIIRVRLSIAAECRAAYCRWNRVACDLSVLGAAAAYELEGQSVRGLHLVLGGLGPKARRFPEIEALFEGSKLPSREKIEEAIAPLLHPIDDLRASAAFKRLRGAQLAAEAILVASATSSARAQA